MKISTNKHKKNNIIQSSIYRRRTYLQFISFMARLDFVVYFSYEISQCHRLCKILTTKNRKKKPRKETYEDGDYKTLKLLYSR